MAKQTKSKQQAPRFGGEDPAGAEWRGQASAAWAQAVKDAADAGSAEPIEFYSAPPLPAWSKPRFVQRELFGRYLHDRDANVVHDVEHASKECRVDAIANATFIHFLHELEQHVPDAEPCKHCMGASEDDA